MLIIRGSYHFWPMRVGFRNDYCLRCQAPRRSIAVRTFDVGHLFWIPILPVGFWKRWQCEVCGQAPHARPKVRRFFKWVGLVFSIAFSVLLWAALSDANDGVLGWILRVGAPAGGILLLFDLFRGPREPSLRRELASIAPATDAVCPFCATPLLAGSGTRWMSTTVTEASAAAMLSGVLTAGLVVGPAGLRWTCCTGIDGPAG